MSLAETLRVALARGHAGDPVLLPGDELETNEGAPAAVLVAVVDRPDPTVILTLRPETLRRHAGQVSFPGGRIEPDDGGPIAAALREAEEEIGLPPDEVNVVGIADRYVTITGFEVIPVVGVVPPDLPLTPHPGEVAEMFEAPLYYLLDPAHQQVRTATLRGRERTYYEIDWDGQRIWGATAAMIVNLSRRLVFSPPFPPPSSSPPWEQGGAGGGSASTRTDSSGDAPAPDPSLRAGRGD